MYNNAKTRTFKTKIQTLENNIFLNNNKTIQWMKSLLQQGVDVCFSFGVISTECFFCFICSLSVPENSVPQRTKRVNFSSGSQTSSIKSIHTLSLPIAAPRPYQSFSSSPSETNCGFHGVQSFSKIYNDFQNPMSLPTLNKPIIITYLIFKDGNWEWYI